MNAIETKRPYRAPMVEVALCPRPLSLLVALSAEGGIEDWEEGEEL